MRTRDRANESPSDRGARWLRELKGGYEARPEVLPILAKATRRAEIELLKPFLEDPGWYVDGDSFECWHTRVTPKATIDGYQADFLNEDRRTRKRRALDLLDHRLEAGARLPDTPRSRAIRAAVQQYDARSVFDVPLMVRQIEADLSAIAREIPKNSNHAYGRQSLPRLIFRPLPDDFELFGESAKTRMERLDLWLSNSGYELSDDLLRLLALCDWHGTVKFALPILLLEGVKALPDYTALRHGYGIRLKAPIGKQKVDFVVGRLGNKTTPPSVIEVLKPSSYQRPAEERLQRARRDEVESAGYRYLPVALDEASEQGAWWAEQLKKSGDEAVILRDRFRQ